MLWCAAQYDGSPTQSSEFPKIEFQTIVDTSDSASYYRPQIAKQNFRRATNPMKSNLTAFLVVFLVCAVVPPDTWAQATAQISGVVHDQSGAVLPGVELLATQTETGITRSTVTNETGSYIFTNMPIGP